MHPESRSTENHVLSRIDKRGARRPVVALALLFITVAVAAGDGLAEEGHPLSLDEAIVRALDRADDVVIERRFLDAAEAAVRGAGGAYDPVLTVETGFERASPPVNSAFSGAPPGEAAPTTEAAVAGALVRQLLPTGGELSLRASLSRSESDASFDLLSPAYDSRLGFELRQPLLRRRGVDSARLGLRVSAADRDRAAASLRRQVRDTVAAVEGAYWTLVAAVREVEVRGEAVALAAEQLLETEIRIDNGVAPETEVAQPRAELERRRGELLVARENVARAESALKLLILADGDDDLWLAPLEPQASAEVERKSVDAAAALGRALASRAELSAAGALVERRRAERRFAADGVRPDLDLVVSYDRYGLAGSRNRRAEPIPGLDGGPPAGLDGGWSDSAEQLFDGDFDDARVALVFELPLGNRGAVAEARVAESAEQRSLAELARVRKQVRAEVLDAVAAVDTADGRIEASRSARRAAEVQLTAERERFAVGLSTNFLVLTRQNDLSSARLAEIEALTDYRRARTELARATGSLLSERGIDIYER